MLGAYVGPAASTAKLRPISLQGNVSSAAALGSGEIPARVSGDCVRCAGCRETPCHGSYFAAALNTASEFEFHLKRHTK